MSGYPFLFVVVRGMVPTLQEVPGENIFLAVINLDKKSITHFK